MTAEACAYCGDACSGKYTIHREGFGYGPEVGLCDACGGPGNPESNEIWQRIGKWELIPNEMIRRVLAGLKDPLLTNADADLTLEHDYGSGEPWVVGLGFAWANCSMWVLCYPDSTFAELVEKAKGDAQLQSFVRVAASSGALPFDVLKVVKDW